MIHLGIDPGKKGGIAGLDDNGELYHCSPYTPMALKQAIVNLHINDFSPALKQSHISIEKAQAFPGQGVSGMFNYGKGCGIIEGIVIAFAVPYELVNPRVWQKVMFAGTDSKLKTKARAWQACQRIFPNYYHSFMTARGNVHDGMVDAALIAEFGRRTSS